MLFFPHIELHNDLLFLPERMKLEKVEKIVANLHNKAEYVIHMKNLKQALNYWLVFEKIYRVIKFNQDASLKAYIDMNTDIRKVARNDFEKDSFKLNNVVFESLLENVRKHKDIKLATKKEGII